MTAKEYLSQAWHADRMLTAKLNRSQSLRSLAEKATSALTPTPPNKTRNKSLMEDAIARLIDLEDEVNGDIIALVDLKREIATAIKCVSNFEYQILLELRYLCYMQWSEIAAEMAYSKQHMFRLHDLALKEIEAKAKDESWKTRMRLPSYDMIIIAGEE